MTRTRRDIRRAIGSDIQGALSGGMRLHRAVSFTDTTFVDPAASIQPGQWIIVGDGITRGVSDVSSTDGTTTITSGPRSTACLRASSTSCGMRSITLRSSTSSSTKP